jgi:hypothetical protein
VLTSALVVSLSRSVKLFESDNPKYDGVRRPAFVPNAAVLAVTVTAPSLTSCIYTYTSFHYAYNVMSFCTSIV